MAAKKPAKSKVKKSAKPKTNKPLIVGTATAKPGTKSTGWLQLAELPDGQPLQIPVIAVRGAKPGPTLWVEACIHGDEYAGTFIIHEFIRRLNPKAMSGNVVAVPALNITAFQAGKRTSPFEIHGTGDLNRNFPGSADGTLTEQMGHAIFSAITKTADYLIDFHTGYVRETRWLLYANVEGVVGKMSERLARAYGFDVILPAPPTTLGASAFMNAAKRGIPSIIVESGGFGPAFDDRIVADSAERLVNVARMLGIVSGKPAERGKLTYVADFAWVNSRQGGLFRPSVLGGQRIAKGDVIGRFYDLYGELVEEARAPASGIVLTLHPGPMMATGDTLIQIGVNPREV
jgi:predicted deacylase